MEKRCSKCKQVLPANMFYKNAKQSDGLQNFCKVCMNAYNIARAKTAEGRNEPSRRKSWADGILRTLRLDESEY